ncbi:hypothetical protein ANN_14854 [Periplaneta americana]|uniref:Uncharacterized protein n=1 Tax=Periplaneta americana TaxID=6978 RepID=A0ABQ8SZL1_PERAM|nr:hypothetical protein ANN_14854 [Periplaneta americana]
MAGLCEGGNEPPGSLKARELLRVLYLSRGTLTLSYIDEAVWKITSKGKKDIASIRMTSIVVNGAKVNGCQIFESPKYVSQGNLPKSSRATAL